MNNRRTGPYNNIRYQYTDYDDITDEIDRGLIERDDDDRFEIDDDYDDKFEIDDDYDDKIENNIKYNQNAVPTFPAIKPSNSNITVIPVIPSLNYSNIRFFNANGNTESIDIYINGRIVASNLAFREYTNYLKLKSKSYRITFYKAGRTDLKIYEKYINVQKNSNYILTFEGITGSFSTLLLRNNCNVVNKLKTEIRFINVSSNSSPIDVYVDGVVVIKGFSYNDVSKYLSMFEGLHDIALTISDTMKVVAEETQILFEGGKCYSIYVTGNYSTRVPIQLNIIQE